jgi:hypothetical protein
MYAHSQFIAASTNSNCFVLADAIIVEGYLVLYRFTSQVLFCVVGEVDENPFILVNTQPPKKNKNTEHLVYN